MGSTEFPLSFRDLTRSFRFHILASSLVVAASFAGPDDTVTGACFVVIGSMDGLGMVTHRLVPHLPHPLNRTKPLLGLWRVWSCDCVDLIGQGSPDLTTRFCIALEMQNDQIPLLPPLRGDGRGNYRVHIKGNCGSGKSTLALELASLLGVTCIPLDELRWNPGWVETPPDEFVVRVRGALAEASKGWVIEGNYDQFLGTLVSDQATDIIWLDPPFLLYFPRLLLRTFSRKLGFQPPCSPGCPESFIVTYFSRDSVLLYALKAHWQIQKREQELLELDGILVGGKRRRIGGWGRELAQWKQSVRDMLANS